ncbi:hypothetical protein MTO96_009700 [Rhipicephalus appendiculatus]
MKGAFVAIDDVALSEGPCRRIDFCDFETDFCNWKLEKQGLGDGWKKISAATDTAAGPSHDHTLGTAYGHYVLFVSKRQGDSASLYSPILEKSRYRCFRYWFNMAGDNDGTLSVYQWLNGSSRIDGLKPAWSRSGDQMGAWRRGHVTLHNLFRYQIVIEAFKTTANVSGYSHIALDDLEFSLEPCEERVTCSFESDACGWISDTKRSSIPWTRTTGSAGATLGGPDADVTMSSSYGHYMLAKVGSTSERSEIILLSDYVDVERQSSYCFSLWYIFWDTRNSSLLIKSAKDGAANTELLLNLTDGLTWTKEEVIVLTGPQWNYAHVRFDGDSAVFLSFEASKTQGGYTALDDIAVNVGPCPTPPLCDFEADDCGWRARNGSAQLQWERLTAEDAIGGQDHTFGFGSGHVLAVNTSKQGAEIGTTVTTFSETQETRSSGCTRFWYQLSGGHTLSLGTSQGGTLRPEATFKESQLLGSGVWHSAQVNLKFIPTMPFEYYLQVTLDSKGGAAAVDDIQVLSQCSNLGSCDFETDFCLWENEPISSGSALWNRFTGRSHMFGPDVDHTFSESFGTYVAMKNNINTTDLPSALVSPLLTKCDDMCFSFWSYHFGTVPHMLNLFLRTESGDNVIEYSATADVNGRWVKAQTNISSGADECRIGFSVTFPAFHSSLLALDDFIIVTGPCKPLEDTNHPEFSCDNETKHLTRDRICNFENDCADGEDEKCCGTECSFESKDTCYWEMSGKGAQWSVEQARNSSLAEPTQDHTTETEEGSFLRFKMISAYDKERSAVIASPNLIDASPTCTLGFWYYSTLTTERAIIKVTYGFASKLRLKDTTVLLMSGHNGTLERKKWKYATSRIGRVSERFSVKFLGNFESFDKTFLLDDLKFSQCNREKSMWETAAEECPPGFFSCANGNCIPKDTVCDFNDDCGDLSDERLSPRANCTSFPARCDFEDSVCDWKVESAAWGRRLNKRDERAISEDDLRDHTTNSVYGNFLRFLFAEQSLQKGIFSSPIIGAAKDTECSLRFYYTYQTRFTHLEYSLYSLSAGSLAVYLRFDLLGEKHIVWKTSNVFGQYYERKIISLKGFDGPMQVLIEATTGVDLNGAWAIDDISFTDGCVVSSLSSLPILASEATTKSPLDFCNPEEFACPDKTCISVTRVCDFVDDCIGGADEANCATCNFDNGTCGWQDVSFGRYSWKRLETGRNGVNPSSDVSGKRFFMSVTTGDGVVYDRAVMKSVPHGTSSDSCYLEMFYYVSNVVRGLRRGVSQTTRVVLARLRQPLRNRDTVASKSSPAFSDGSCLPYDRVCDFRKDCSDGSDEKNCVQPSCDFEKANLCGWAVVNNASLVIPAPATRRFTTYSFEDEFTWKAIQANDKSDKANVAMRPGIDHSEGTQQGWYALANSAYGGMTEASLLYSPRPLSRTAGSCLAPGMVLLLRRLSLAAAALHIRPRCPREAVVDSLPLDKRRDSRGPPPVVKKDRSRGGEQVTLDRPLHIKRPRRLYSCTQSLGRTNGGETSRARLASYVISTNPKLPCHVRFWYNLPERGVALDVYRQTSLETGGNTHVSTLPVTGEDIWERTDIDFGTQDEAFRVVIEAVYSANVTQGVALDDITMTDGCRRAERTFHTCF